MLLLVLIIASFLIACLLTAALRFYAIKNNVIDVPGHRSSHSVPTPRGGGVAIVVTFILGIILLSYNGMISIKFVLALAIPGIITAVVGFMDDHGHIAAKWRLLAHFSAAALGMYFIGGFPTVDIFGYQLDSGIVGIIFGIVYLVWMLNLYNFMDGINGLASIELVSFCLLSLLILNLADTISVDKQIQATLLLAAGSGLGFLVWNFPKAKIFMGDAGSGFIGITLGLIVLLIADIDSKYFFSEIILLGVFIIDATMTLIRRVLSGKRFDEAHSSHCYQRLSRKYNSHAKVSWSVLAINCLWLAPIAYMINISVIPGILGLVIAWIPLVILAWRAGAGVTDN